MRSSAFFALLFLAATAAAQTPAEQIKRLQNDPNIIWIGEVYRDYENLDGTFEGGNFERHQPITLPDGTVLHSHRQRTSTLKRVSTDGYGQDWESYIWEQFTNPDAPAFADENLTKRLSAAAKKGLLTTRDTTETFDPSDFTVVLSFTVNELKPKDIYAYRLRQLVYYNAKENMYYNLPLSIAAIRIVWVTYNGTDEILSIKPLFWMPVVASSTPINPNQSPDMAIIKSVTMDMKLAGGKVLKKSKPFEAVNKMWFDYMASQKNSILATSPEDNPNKNVLSPQAFVAKINPVDTVITFDPETFEEIVSIERGGIDFKTLDLRFNQTIGWDEQKKMFTIASYSLAPLRVINDYDGSVLNILPLFYLYPHRRFKTVPR